VQERRQSIGEIQVRGAVELVAVDVARVGRFRRFPVLHHQQPQRKLASDGNRDVVDAVGIADALDEEGPMVPETSPADLAKVKNSSRPGSTRA
jgi:hypothetical protein